MKIESISTNFRGRERDLDISNPIVVIHGANAVGKTTILDAIQASLLGYIPRIGKAGQKLAAIIGPSNVAKATIKIEGKKPITFSLSRDADGATKKKHDKVPLTVNPAIGREFLAAGTTERIKIIQNCLGGSGDPRKDLGEILALKLHRDEVANVAGASKDLGEWTDETKDNFKRIIAELKASHEAASKSVLASDIEDAPEFNDNAYQDLLEEKSKLTRFLGSTEQKIEDKRREYEHLAKVARLKEEFVPKYSHFSISEAQRLVVEKGNEFSRLSRELREAKSRKVIKVCKCCGCTEDGWRKDLTADQIEEVKQKDTINIEEVKAKMETLEQELNSLDHDISEATAENERREAREEIIVVTEYGKSLSKSQEGANSRLAEINSALETLESARSAFLAYQERQRAAREASSAAQNLAGKLQRHLDAQKALNEALEAKASDTLAPVLSAANIILGDILPVSLTNRGFVIGYECNGVFVPLEGLSGSEQAVAVAAISAALASTDDLKVALIDESGIFTGDRLEQFIENLQEAIAAGILNQAIIVGTLKSSNADALNIEITA